MIALPRLLAGTAFALALAAPALAATPVPLGPFSQIELRSGGHVTLRHGAVQSVTLVEGSTTYTRLAIREDGRLVIDACNDNCPHDYHLTIEIVSPAIDAVAIDGGGAIVADGTFPAQSRLAAAVSGGGHIDVRAMPANSVEAAVNGGGKILTRPVGALTAAVNGGGDITYWGNPSVSEAVQGGGRVARGTQ